MMKIFRNAFLVAAALVLGFTSCNKDDVPPVSNELKAVSFTLSGSSTRAVGIDASGAITFNSGVLYFHDGTNIVRSYMLTTATSTYATGGNIINITDAEGGVTIINLPANISHVAVVGNTTTPLSGTIASVRGYVLDMASQMNPDNVNLYGNESIGSPAVGAGTNGNDLYTVAVEIEPVVARFQLTDITAANRAGYVNHIVSFNVDAIFFDEYFNDSNVWGATRTGFTAGTGTPAELVTYFTGGTAIYALPGTGPSSYNWDNVNLPSTSLRVAPASGVWGYNTFAGIAGDETTVPYIIIRLSNIVVSYDGGTTLDNTTFAGAQFLTIRGFMSAGVQIDEIVAGNVYTVGAGVLRFTEQDLRPQPKENLIDVDVTVTVADWNPVPVEPII
jgi:hypothetical protein